MAKSFDFMDVLNKYENDDSVSSFKRISISKLEENEDNRYPLSDLEDLANSIETLGLLQPLLVKKNENNKYTIIAGHRRFNAIKHLIENGRLEEDYLINIKEIPSDEDELITKFKLHETNLQTRSLLKMSESEKLEIIQHYIDLLDQARACNMPIKGKTRDLVAERFNIAPSTAGALIAKSKGKDNPKPQKSFFEKMYFKISKIGKDDLTSEDKAYLIEIKGLIDEYDLD